MKNLIPKENKAWIDLLRIVACFLVVMAHCCDPFVARFDSNRHELVSGVYWGSLVRCSVPLFVMMTGTLLLPISESMTAFYKKRISRVVIAFLFWAVVTPWLYFSYFALGASSQSPNIVMDTYTLDATWNKMYTFLFNFHYDIIPLWYVYMLIGLYLFIPVINPWLKESSKRDIELFLGLWGVSMLVPIVQLLGPVLGYNGNYGNPGILGVCAWNPFGTFYYFSGFLGYLVLAFYLNRFPLAWNMQKRLTVAIPLFAVGYLITSQAFLYIQQFYPSNYEYLEIPWYFFGVNVLMMTFAVYIVLQKVKIPSTAWMSKMASLMFGVFLSHFFIVQVVYDTLYPVVKLPAYINIPLFTIVSFTISYGIVWILDKFRITRRFVR